MFDTAKYEWKIYGGTVVQSELEDAINQGSGGKFDLLAAKLANLKSSNEKELNEDMFGDGTDNSGKVSAGFSCSSRRPRPAGRWAGSTAPTSRSGATSTAAGTLSAAAYDNLRAAMRSVLQPVQQRRGGRSSRRSPSPRGPSSRAFEGLLLANERFTSKDSGDGGFKNEVLKFKGCEARLRRRLPRGGALLPQPQVPEARGPEGPLDEDV